LFCLSKLRSETRMAFLFGNKNDEDGDEIEGESEDGDVVLVNSDHIDEVLALLGLNKEDDEWLC